MMIVMILMEMLTATTTMMIISMGNACNSRVSGLPGSWITAGRPYWSSKTENYDARDHVLTAEEINKGLLLLPALPTSHVSEYRLSQFTPIDPDNGRFTEGHREGCSWP